MYQKIIKDIVNKIFVLICIITILLSFFCGLFSESLGFHEASDYDRFGGGPHTFTVPDAGDAIKIPQNADGSVAFEQCTNDYEGYHQGWGAGTSQRKLYDMWSEKGETHSDRHWAYIEVAGTPRYIVALAPIYGVVGDYVDIHITHNGESKVYPCIIGDGKDIWVDPTFEYEGKIYGHKEDDGRCKIIEVCTELLGNSTSTSLISPLLNELKDITLIANGGSIFDHPEGPVGLEGPYNYDDGTSSGEASSDADTEANTFTGALTMICREIWTSMSVFFENSFYKRDDVTVLYDFKNLRGDSSSSSSSADALGITDETLKAIYEEYEKNKGAPYRMDHSNLKYDECMDYYDCSSWVIHCLAHTGIKKIPDSTAEGIFTGYCTKVEVNDRKPGDLIFLQNTYTTGISHVGIYMGEMTVDGEKAEWIIDTGSNETEGVKISRYDNGWWNGEHFYAFGRLNK